VAADPSVGLAHRLQELCLARGLTVATAESCTGGLVAATLTSVPGSSGYVRGGVVAYADDVKTAALDVPAVTIADHGAVSEETAQAMAEGVRRRFAVDLAVSVTGIAGPEGGTVDKPVGLTYIAVATSGGTTTRRYLWSGDREVNRRDSTRAALEDLIAAVDRAPAVP
jgi:nicotinamide-nucleotide amidase